MTVQELAKSEALTPCDSVETGQAAFRGLLGFGPVEPPLSGSRAEKDCDSISFRFKRLNRRLPRLDHQAALVEVVGALFGVRKALATGKYAIEFVADDARDPIAIFVALSNDVLAALTYNGRQLKPFELALSGIKGLNLDLSNLQEIDPADARLKALKVLVTLVETLAVAVANEGAEP